MILSLPWAEIALRLALTVFVGVLIGYNRSQHGKAAGMRTTVLVCLAASVAMIQVNLLLPSAGRAPNSFVMNDLMRLPLGILTGVGFIGAGAIVHRANLVVGVTTAATLWLVTVIGLCLGGGQIALGLAATALGLFSLWVLKGIEGRLPQEHRARLRMELNQDGPPEADIRSRLAAAQLLVVGNRTSLECRGGHRTLILELRQVRRWRQTEMPTVVSELAGEAGVIRLEWRGLA
jgi:putative Mg2+ transporter-C (MgtC) family protein